MRHLRLANAAVAAALGSARKSDRAEVCLVDYASCPASDVCWVIDFASGCEQSDNCLVDTS